MLKTCLCATGLLGSGPSWVSELNLSGQPDFFAIKCHPSFAITTGQQDAVQQNETGLLCFHRDFPFPETLTFAPMHNYTDGPCVVVFSFRVLCTPSPICVPSNAASQTGFDWHHSVWISVIGKYLILIPFCLSFIAVAGSYVSSFFLNVAVFLLSAIANILNTWTCLLIPACISLVICACLLNRVPLFATLRTVALQAHLFLGFSR